MDAPHSLALSLECRHVDACVITPAGYDALDIYIREREVYK